MTTISYAITAWNEAVELERLLDQLNEYIRPEDEIVLQLDTTATDEVKKVAEKYNVGSKYGYHRIYTSLNNDFAIFKNNLKAHCVKDYIFFIDADEYLTDILMLNLPEVLQLNPLVDIYAVPRINTVDGLTEEHVEKWGWRVDENEWINYPDFQTRICKNRKDIYWVGKVHERLTADKLCTVQMLPEGFDLYHPKDITRQEKQNSYYNTL
jgi:glycosyltransferase involved in cell wall biosynthesis